jgi:hypothetical protein
MSQKFRTFSLLSIYLLALSFGMSNIASAQDVSSTYKSSVTNVPSTQDNQDIGKSGPDPVYFVTQYCTWYTDADGNIVFDEEFCPPE